MPRPRRPKLRRVAKVALVLAVVVGAAWAFSFWKAVIYWGGQRGIVMCCDGIVWYTRRHVYEASGLSLHDGNIYGEPLWTRVLYSM